MTKLRDLIMKANKVKTNVICPNYGFDLPCPNLLLRDYCPNNHIPAIKKAWQIQTEAIMSGQKIDQNLINLALKIDAENQFMKYSEMWIKYPNEPSEKQ